MLNNEIEEKMRRYNTLRQEADDLQSEIEDYLANNYNIDESDYCRDITNPYSMDGVCPIYEWGERYFDIDMIKEIIDFYESFEKKNGENPEIHDVANHFMEKYNN